MVQKAMAQWLPVDTSLDWPGFEFSYEGKFFSENLLETKLRGKWTCSSWKEFENPDQKFESFTSD